MSKNQQKASKSIKILKGTKHQDQTIQRKKKTTAIARRRIARFNCDPQMVGSRTIILGASSKIGNVTGVFQGIPKSSYPNFTLDVPIGSYTSNISIRHLRLLKII